MKIVKIIVFKFYHFFVTLLIISLLNFKVNKNRLKYFHFVLLSHAMFLQCYTCFLFVTVFVWLSRCCGCCLRLGCLSTDKGG